MQIVCTVCAKHSEMYRDSKDGITILTILDTRRPKKSGLYPVKVQVVHKRVQKYYTTGKELSPEDWMRLPETKAHLLVSIRNSIKNSFDIIWRTAEDLISAEDFSFENLNIRLSRTSGETINIAFKLRIDELKADDHIGTMLWYDNVLKSIERFAGSNVPLLAITEEWLKRFEKFLLAEEKTYATISMHMRAIRAIMNRAKKVGYIKESQYPFGQGKYEIKEGQGRKMALTLDQIGQIVNYKGSPETERYRDLWFFLYLCNGINVADFLKLKYSNIIDGEICYIRQKTEHTTKTIKEIRAIVTPEMQDIIDRWGGEDKDGYIFPYLDGYDSDSMQIKKRTQDITRRINKHMKKVGDALGIGNISTYTARHSFATVLKRSGANIAYISESLGHNSLQTTETYLASFEKEERQKNAALLTQFSV